MATRCCCPPESFDGLCLSRWPSPTWRRMSSALAWQSGVRPARDERKQHVVDGRQVMDQVELLEHEADLLAAEDILLDLVHRGDGLAVDRDRSRGRAVESAQEVKQACSCPIRTVRQRTNTPRAGPRRKRRAAPRFPHRRCETTLQRRRRGSCSTRPGAGFGSGVLRRLHCGLHPWGSCGKLPGRVQAGQRCDHDRRDDARGHKQGGKIEPELEPVEAEN